MPFDTLAVGTALELLVDTTAHHFTLPAVSRGGTATLQVLEPDGHPAYLRLLRTAASVCLLVGRRLEPVRVRGVEAGPPPRVYLESQPAGIATPDQRQTHRVAVPLWAATVVVQSPQRVAQRRVQLVDLSQGGAGLLSAQPLPAAADLQLVFGAGEQRFALASRVAWSEATPRGRLYGLRFVAVTRSTQYRLDQLVFQLRWQHDTPSLAG